VAVPAEQEAACPATCTGSASPELATALSEAARKAVGCYKRVLRTKEVQGSLTVKVEVEASGNVCRTAIESSGPDVEALAPCVRPLFEGKQFPPATGACVNVNIPISFSIKDAPLPPMTELSEAPPGSPIEEGAAAVRARGWSKAKRMLSAALPAIEASGALDEVLAAHALLGRACTEAKDTKCAVEHYAKVLEIFRQRDFQRNLAALGGDDAVKARRTGRALMAAGEAAFFAAEQKRAEADKIAFPVYTGSGKKDDVERFVKQKVMAWVGKKHPAIEEAERAYRAIVDLQPVPPPRWVVAAADRVGTLWDGFVRALHGAPVPAEWKRSGPVPGAPGLTYEELRAEFSKQLDEAAEPYVRSARSAFATCREQAAKHGIVDEHSRACEAWLAAHP
jgi:hypothetical protein